MGLQYPAEDYVHGRMNVIDYCNIGANSIVIETSAGHVVVDKSLPCTLGYVVLIQHSGRYEFAKPMGSALITDDGEAIEGEALDEVNVLGRVIQFINRVIEDDTPIVLPIIINGKLTLTGLRGGLHPENFPSRVRIY